jgi:FlgD Ig-like domain
MRPLSPAFRRRLAGCSVALACLVATSAGAAQIQVTLPTVSAPPGATVIVPIQTSPGPAGLGIQAVEFRMDFLPGVIQSSFSRPDGWLQAWGEAFVNANDAFVAVAAGGFPAATSAGTLLNTLELTISPSALPGTDMPLTFQHVLCNEGEPAVVVTPGLLRVRTNAAVEPGAGTGFALSPASPNPAASVTRFTLTVPSGGANPVRVAVYAVDGRLVRELANGPLGPGRHELGWDTRDAAGAPVRAGLYFARASLGPARAVRRLAVTR